MERAEINLMGEGYCKYYEISCHKCSFINHCKNPYNQVNNNYNKEIINEVNQLIKEKKALIVDKEIFYIYNPPLMKKLIKQSIEV